MKETNFYPGIYKIIVVIVCLMLYVTIHKAHAAASIKISTDQITKTKSLLTHNHNAGS